MDAVSLKLAKNYTDKEVKTVDDRITTLTIEQQQDGEVIEARKGEVSLKAKMDSVDAQLAETEQLSGNLFAKTTVINPDITPKAYMTIIDDDGRVEFLTKIKPIAITHNIPITLAIPINYNHTSAPLTQADLLDLQNNLGWEIASHSYSHGNLRVMTDEQIDFELHESKKALRRMGLDVKNFVAPYGSNDEPRVRKIAAKYYNCCATVGGNRMVKPVKNYLLNRVALGSYTGAGQNTLEFYKSHIDQAVAKNGWVIYMTHSYSLDHDETQTQHLNDLIVYAKSLGVEIVNLQDGFEKMGNMIEIEGVASIGFDGTSTGKFSNDLTVTKTNNEYSSTDLITAFPNKHITVFNANLAGATGFPNNNAGICTTYRQASVGSDYQEFKEYNNYNKWIRYVLGNGQWSAWKLLYPGLEKYQFSWDCGTIEAGAFKYIDISEVLRKPLTGEIFLIQADETTRTPGEIIVTSESRRIKLYNTHTDAMTVGTILFNVSVL